MASVLSSTVGDRQHPRAARFRGLHRRERVGRLATLADRDDEIVLREDRLSVPHLAADLDLRRNLRQLLHPVPPRHRRVRAGAARDEIDARDRPRDLRREPDLFADDVRLGHVHAPAQRVFDRARLLMDLLEHEVLVAPLFRLGRGPVDVLARALHRRAVERRDLGAALGQGRDVAVVEEDDLARVREERGNVAGGEHLSLPHAEHQRRLITRDDDLVG
jgi:hypothetical protein